MDPLAVLRHFTSARADKEADEWLGRLIMEHADPVIARVIAAADSRSFGKNARDRTDAEDIASHARERIIAKCRALRSGRDDQAIEDFGAYAATAAITSRAAFLRKKHPRRSMLANQVRYLLDNCGPEKVFAVARSTDGDLLAALRDQPVNPAAAATDPDGWQALPDGVDWSGVSLAHALRLILEHTRAPIDFECLLTWLARLRGVSDDVLSLDAQEHAVQHDPALSRADDAGHAADWGHYLTGLWQQLLQISLRQRTAFLLHFDELRELEAKGITTQAGIAAALEMTAGELAEFWNDVPVADNRIAVLLGATRQQVINLRMVARSRLRKWTGELLADA